MHQAVRAVKHQVAAVQVRHVPEDGEGVLLRGGPCAFRGDSDRADISAQVASENLKKLGGNAQVGIEVILEYEDGSTETRFIDLY